MFGPSTNSASMFGPSTSGASMIGPSTNGASMLGPSTKSGIKIQPAGGIPSGGGGGGGGGTNVLGNYTQQPQPQPQPRPQPAPDPYAKWGGQAQYNRLVSGFDTQKSGINSSARAAAKTSGLGLRNSILDFIDTLRTGQQQIDNRGINNELARQRGTADVYQSMNQGIRSGGVTLANRNASDSSAAEAIARAYGDIGRRQMSDIGNQYEMENVEIGMSQEDLARQRASGLRRFESAEEQAVTSIVADATDKLSALDAAMANASLPERIALNSEKNAIRNQVESVLEPYMSKLSQANKVKAMGGNARIAEATRRRSLGMAPSKQFDFSTDTPVGLEDSGPVSSELPIFTYRNNNEE